MRHPSDGDVALFMLAAGCVVSGSGWFAYLVAEMTGSALMTVSAFMTVLGCGMAFLNIAADKAGLK